MATCKVIPPAGPEYLLTLTAYEAKVLFAVTGVIGGIPDDGHPRGAIANIRRVLAEANVGSSDIRIQGTIGLYE